MSDRKQDCRHRPFQPADEIIGDKRDFHYAVTVFTATYNRAHLLPRVYRSLALQTFRNFEWLVVDDGSTDHTEEVVRSLAAEGTIPVRYVRKPHEGLHFAINRGVRESLGFFFAGLDSDDWYHPDALERLMRRWAEIPEHRRMRYAGVVGLSEFNTGQIEGNHPTADVVDSDPVEIRLRYGMTGNRAGIMRTEVLREFPFPEDQRAFVTEQLIWNRIGRRYLTRYVNERVTIIEYQQGGLTELGFEHSIEGAPTTCQFYKELLEYPHHLPLKYMVKSYAQYIRFALHAGTSLSRQWMEAPSTSRFALLYPLGFWLYRRDRRKLARRASPLAHSGE